MIKEKKWIVIVNYWQSLTSGPTVISSTALITCITKLFQALGQGNKNITITLNFCISFVSNLCSYLRAKTIRPRPPKRFRSSPPTSLVPPKISRNASYLVQILQVETPLSIFEGFISTTNNTKCLKKQDDLVDEDYLVNKSKI